MNPKNICFGEGIIFSFKNYFNFNGRATRSEFWYCMLEWFLLSPLLAAITLLSPTAGLVLRILIFFANFFPAIFLQIRRLHDIGKSGWNLLLYFIPLVGTIILIVYFCKESSAENKWGKPAYEISDEDSSKNKKRPNLSIPIIIIFIVSVLLYVAILFATKGKENKIEENTSQTEEVNVPKTKIKLDMVKIPGKGIEMLRTEVTQGLYESVMGENPSYFQLRNEELSRKERKTLQKICGNDTSKLPVQRVSWYNAIYFCNKLSEMKRLKPVYSVDGETDTSKWNYTPHNGDKIEGKVSQDKNANGLRLPTSDEWEYAALGGKNYKYAGSDNLDKVGWYKDNSNDVPHPIATKKSNGYGLYDMSGNVDEWVWDSFPDFPDYRCFHGGSYLDKADYCEVSYYDGVPPNIGNGFRIVRTTE